MPFRVVGVVALDSEEQIVGDNAKRKENWMQVRTAPVVRPARAIRPAGYGSIRIRWGRASSTTSAAGRPAYPQISRDFHRSRRIRPRLRWRERARKRLHGRVEVSPPPKIDSPDPGERKRKEGGGEGAESRTHPPWEEATEKPGTLRTRADTPSAPTRSHLWESNPRPIHYE